ncbi:DUF7524 family protein [Halostella pelagica]|uniref:DUF7524 family protein n=1 Tax=Halostella pelagica TaxID=2583824 RepID=UPI0010818540|nr:hypothetical protein [Halostella pelagica]
MPRTLAVHVNDETLHAITVETRSFETAGAFDIELVNHGRAVHVHLNLMEGLERGATLEATNHFVETETVRRVALDVVDGALPASGKLKIVTGYGAETAYVDVTAREAENSVDAVDIDETLAEPGGTADTDVDRQTDARSLLPTPLAKSAPVVALAGVALFVALLAATVVDAMFALFGLAVVLVGVFAAGAILVRG